MVNEQRRRRSGPSIDAIMRARWVMTALTALLAVVLFASGAYLIGAFVVLITATRVVMMVMWQRRRAQTPRARRQ